MKKRVICAVVMFVCAAAVCSAQCSICTKTAQQLGPGPAQGLNAGILYLMLTPLAIGGFIGYRWWKNEKHIQP